MSLNVSNETWKFYKTRSPNLEEFEERTNSLRHVYASDNQSVTQPPHRNLVNKIQIKHKQAHTLESIKIPRKTLAGHCRGHIKYDFCQEMTANPSKDYHLFRFVVHTH